MSLQIYTWLVLYLATGLATLAFTAHVIATDEGLTQVRRILRRARGTAGTTTTLEGHHHEHDSD
ncbi:MAG: hypothetical protein GEV10_09740 [Streptosporangiales bacterium]|nr:hypothetical protein [Streptosporangiales bacterium]